MAEFHMDERRHVTLCETLDRVLNKGAVIAGEVTIAVADVDLIRLGLQLVLASVASLEKDSAPEGQSDE